MATLAPHIAELAAKIDHTILKAEALPSQIDAVCREAQEWRFAAVCVNPLYVARCVAHLKGSGIAVATVCGFPLGATTTADKCAEAGRAVAAGASEVDMVLQLGALLASELSAVRDDMAAVVDATKRANPAALVKVIFESAALSAEQIIAACRCAAEAQVDYVKTSTGFHASGGASVEAVRLMHKHAAPIKVKASGGIRDLKTARAMLAAGASRLGLSSSVAIMLEAQAGG